MVLRLQCAAHHKRFTIIERVLSWPITNGSPLRRLANRRTSVGQDYEMSDRRNIVVHDNYRTRYSVVQRLRCILHQK